MTKAVAPDFGELLEPFIAQAGEHIPSFLAMLERGAAERYRQWAEQLPEYREGLLACAAREDEIADTVDGLFPIDAAIREEISKPLPAARELYYSVFQNMEPRDQLAIQADAERQGAAAWRGMLDDAESDEAKRLLEYCARLEETSASYLENLLGA